MVTYFFVFVNDSFRNMLYVKAAEHLESIHDTMNEMGGVASVFTFKAPFDVFVSGTVKSLFEGGRIVPVFSRFKGLDQIRFYLEKDVLVNFELIQKTIVVALYECKSDYYINYGNHDVQKGNIKIFLSDAIDPVFADSFEMFYTNIRRRFESKHEHAPAPAQSCCCMCGRKKTSKGTTSPNLT